jgi:hypothetical protein
LRRVPGIPVAGIRIDRAGAAQDQRAAGRDFRCGSINCIAWHHYGQYRGASAFVRGGGKIRPQHGNAEQSSRETSRVFGDETGSVGAG